MKATTILCAFSIGFVTFAGAPALASIITNADTKTQTFVNDGSRSLVWIENGERTESITDVDVFGNPVAANNTNRAAPGSSGLPPLPMGAAFSRKLNEAEVKLLRDQFQRVKRHNEEVRQKPLQNSAGFVDKDGCTGGRQMVYVPQRTGLLGLGEKKQVPIGCMTQEELNRWNIEQQNKRPVYIQPAPTYQAPKPIYCSTQYGRTTCF